MSKTKTILKEIPSLREVNKKVFLLSDGTLREIYYPHSVHTYNEESGEYLDAVNTTAIQDTSVAGSNPQSGISLSFANTQGYESYGDYNIVAGKTANKEFAPVINVNFTDFLQRRYKIKKVILLLEHAQTTDTTADARLMLYHDDWTEPIDYASINADSAEYDITKCVISCLRRNYETVSFELVPEFISTQNLVKGFNVTLQLEYESGNEIKTSGSVHSHSIGRFGKGFVDLVRGTLNFECEDFTFDGNKLPVTIKHLYNSALYDTQYTKSINPVINTANFGDMKLGLGWRLNLMQSVISFGDCFIYTDEYGSEHLLTLKEANDNTTVYENTEQEILYDASSGILDFGNEKYAFQNEKLVSITDSKNNSMIITYSDGKIIAVTDGAGRMYSFGYNTSGYLTSVTAPDNTVISYNYTEEYLTKITYPDGGYTQISADSEYIDDCIIIEAFDKNKKPVKTVEYEWNKGKLKTIYGHGVNIGYDHYPENRVMAITDLNESKEYYYIYDADGNKTDEYILIDGDIIPVDASDGLNPYGDFTGFVNRAENLINGHNSPSVSDWIAVGSGCKFEKKNNENLSKFGTDVLIFSGTTERELEKKVNLEKGEYTFSTYIRIDNRFPADTNGINILISDEYNNVLASTENILTTENEFTRLSASFTLEHASEISIRICCQGDAEVYIDGVQLEKNPFATEYNYIDYSNNSQFQNGTVYIDGSLSESQSISIPVKVKQAKDIRESFTLSGWGAINFDGLPVHEREFCSDNTFRLRAVINYKPDENGETDTEEFTADFSPNGFLIGADSPEDIEFWQYQSIDFEKGKFKEIDSISVFCDYDYNIGRAFFDNLRLVRNSIETDLSEYDFSEDEDTTPQSPEVPAPLTSGAEESEEFQEAYDSFGNPLTETIFAEDCQGTIYRSFGYNTEFSDNLEFDRTKSGNDLIYETDSRGNVTTYVTDAVHSRNKAVIDRLGNRTSYEYDLNGRISAVSNRTKFGSELGSVSYSYDGLENLNGITRGDGLGYSLEYNNHSQLLSIGINGLSSPLVKYQYKTNGGKLQKVTYANGDYMETTYNTLGQLMAEKWYNKNNVQTSHYRYNYDAEGNITRSIDILCKKEYNYLYSEGNIISSKEYDITLDSDLFVTEKILASTVRFIYNSQGELIRKRITPSGGAEQVIEYVTDEKGNQSVKFSENNLTVTCLSGSDGLGRKLFDEVQTSEGVISRKYDYLEGKITQTHRDYGKVKSSPTTQLVKQITFADGRTIQYEYDSEERITRVIDSLEGETEYTYDALGQLLTERKKAIGEYVFKTVNKMTYDNYGNITTKNGVYFGYSSLWKDKLIAIGSKSVEYDAQGNPTNYFGNTLTWEKGRQLKSFNGVSFTYNANGIRTAKNANGTEHKYMLDGTKILRETWKDNTLIPLYDNEDSVCGIEHNGTAYYFLKNLQGDVIAILDSLGKTVARYSYDAWGAFTITQDDTDCHIAIINPFRYRGYYFDEDVNLYYLQSRYYDCGTGRFVNGDMAEFATVEQNLLVHNLFAYCGNDGVNQTDYNGYIKIDKYFFHYFSFLKKYQKTIKNVFSIITASLSSLLLSLLLKIQNGVFSSPTAKKILTVRALQNFSSNANLEKSSPIKGYIKDQNKYTKWYLCYEKLSNCGCELIAVYNILRALGKKDNLSTLAFEFEIMRIVMGFGLLGTNPAKLYQVFIRKKVKYGKTFSINTLNKKVKENGYGIVSCWNENSLMLHTFMVSYSSSSKLFSSYNGYNRDQYKYTSLNKMLGKRKFIIGYWFPKR